MDYPNTVEGKIAKCQGQIEGLEDMLATGVLVSSIDGLSQTYRSRAEIVRTISALKLKITQLRNGVSGPFGKAWRI